MTLRLYHDDPLLLSFDARVIAHGVSGGRGSVILDRTAFYPESGGQMADHGTLGGVAVTDVQVDDAAVVHHVLDGALPAVGAELRGALDARRRRLHMAEHTGQHMLSAALQDLARAATVSSRLGESGCTIDVDRPGIAERDLARCEETVNDVIESDEPVRAWFPEAAELASMTFRRESKVTDHVRVVKIGDFDLQTCGGTHCVRTAEVGLLRITGTENYKGMLRIHFAAGRRARETLVAESTALRAMAAEMTCGPLDVPAALARARRDADDARTALGHARERLAEHVAVRLLAERAAGAGSPIVAVLDGDPPEMLRVIAKRVTAEPGTSIVLATRLGDAVQVLAARAKDATLDCGTLVKRLCAQTGGRGGGRPESAEGRLGPTAPRDGEALRALIAGP
jgi:alanyl-tRNA synthetase